jgi:hypothetical protein
LPDTDYRRALAGIVILENEQGMHATCFEREIYSRNISAHLCGANDLVLTDRGVTFNFPPAEHIAPMIIASLREDVEESQYSDEDYDDEDEEEPQSNNRLKSYSYKPNVWSPQGKGPFFGGFELEIALSSYFGEAIDAVENETALHLFCKEDGSVPGFEIVSHPLSTEYLSQHRQSLQRMLKKLVTLGARSHDSSSCGLHVHFPRKFMRDHKSIVRLVTLYDAHEEFFSEFARRSSTQWANFKQKDLLEKGHSQDRYEAVNLTNSSTIEIRIFKGTLKPLAVLATHQLVRATAEIANENGIQQIIKHGQQLVRQKALLPWAKDLKDYLEERGL